MNPIILQIMNLIAAVALAAALFIGGGFFARKNPRFLTALETGWQRAAAWLKRKK